MGAQKGTVLQNGYVLGKGREPLGLTENQIRYAMKNTPSNRQAATFLRVSFNSYKKYALQYIDSESGLSLWELQKLNRNQTPRKPRKKTNLCLYHQKKIATAVKRARQMGLLAYTPK